MAAVELKNIQKSFGLVEVLKGVDLAIEDGEFIVLLGPSGCGKSTILRIIAGLEDQTQGSVSINDQRIDHLPPAKRRIAMVFQTYALYPHLDVAGNWSLGLKQAGEKKALIDERITEASRVLELDELLHRKPSELSGGQRQRVAIGRAIVRHPDVFLFDEPLSNLDAALRSQVRFEIAHLHKRLSATMIYVTHDQIEAMTLASRIVVMNEGKIQQVGTPEELYKTPSNLFVAGFIGSPTMNRIDGVVEEGGVRLGSNGFVSINHDMAVGTAVTLGVRPDGLMIADNGVEAEITLKEYLGRQSYLHASLKDRHSVVIEVEADSDFQVGDRVKLGVQPGAAHFFNPTTGTRLE